MTVIASRRIRNTSVQLWLDLTETHREDWRWQALCAQVDPELFFPEKGGSTTAAKQLCASCPVIEQCLAWAVANNERFGIWGGQTERARRRMSSPAADPKAA